MQKSMILGGVAGLALVAALAFVGATSSAGESVLIRGIVLEQDGNSIKVNYTLVADAADKTKWLGQACDVNVSNAKRYKWENKSGVLTKTRTTSVPTPGKEVVFRGTIASDCRVSASWVVQNYREFQMTGSLEGITLDTGKTDQGYLTVNVSKSVMRGIKPEKKFKETAYKGVDLIFRFNGTTDFTALGKSKQADEVTASQQTVVLDGEIINESLSVSKVKEQ